MQALFELPTTPVLARRAIPNKPINITRRARGRDRQSKQARLRSRQGAVTESAVPAWGGQGGPRPVDGLRWEGGAEEDEEDTHSHTHPHTHAHRVPSPCAHTCKHTHTHTHTHTHITRTQSESRVHMHALMHLRVTVRHARVSTRMQLIPALAYSSFRICSDHRALCRHAEWRHVSELRRETILGRTYAQRHNLIQPSCNCVNSSLQRDAG